VQCSELANGDADSALFGIEGQGEGFAAMGALERAAEGTAFLRGVEALPSPVQDRLAATLQDHQIIRSGGRRPVPLRARLVASTCAPLLELVESGQFRRDLYYRLGVVTIASPPLRERREDIPLLANFFLEKFNRKHNRRVEKFSFEALLVLSTYGWPGNVAELESEVERLVAQDTTGTIKLTDLPAHVQREMTAGTNGVGAANVPLREAKKRFEREYFRDLLRRTKGNMSLASRSSRVGRPYLYKKINDYQIDPNDFR
jgi:DNA-binding NtrC family response regulator